MKALLLKLKLKKAVILLLPIVFAVIAVLAVAYMVGGGKNGGDTPSELLEATKPTDSHVQVVAPPEDEPEESYSVGLAFRSDGDGTCSVVGIGSCTDRVVSIPQKSPTGDTVVSIGHSAFKGIVAIGEVIIPDTVMTVGEDAFKGSGITTVSIGGAVISIGEGAFAACQSLTAINVSGASALYASEGGVLFSRDMTELICYPSGKPGRAYSIPTTVNRIAPEAFSACVSLKEISYGGTEKEWKKVYVCSGNDSLHAASLKFATNDK